jgi:hypothetical protein
VAFRKKQRIEAAMMRGLASTITLVTALIAGCASGPTPPDWQASVLGSTERATEAYLTGRTRIEQLEFAKARSDIARTGKADLIARVELLRCATRVASLVLEECEAFDKLAVDAGPDERSYADYLAGRLQAQDALHLPAAQRDVIKGGAKAIQAMTNPLSRLVAAGVLFRMNLADPTVIALATETASAQGWNRPLLAWLTVQLRRAEMAGDAAESARIKRRIDLVLSTPK